jgi:hypothetical protein
MGWPHVQVLTAPRPTESIMKRIAVGYSQLPTSDTSREQMPVRPQCARLPHLCRIRRGAAPAPTFLSFTHYFSVLTSNKWFTARRNCFSVMIVRFLVPHPSPTHHHTLQTECRVHAACTASSTPSTTQRNGVNDVNPRNRQQPLLAPQRPRCSASDR